MHPQLYHFIFLAITFIRLSFGFYCPKYLSPTPHSGVREEFACCSNFKRFASKSSAEPNSYSAEDIQIRRFVGELGFVEITDWDYYGQTRNPLDPSMPARTSEKKGVSARIFEGRLITGERVLLKEYFPVAKELGINELAMLKRVKEAWENRLSNDPSFGLRELPISNLLGFLLADDSFNDRNFVEGWMTKLPNVSTPKKGNIWLVYQWEGTSTVAGFPKVKQDGEFWDLVSAEFKFKRKWRFIKAIMKSTLEAVSFLHSAGIIHRSIGGTSLLLTTTDDRRENEVMAKLTDFGFAQQFSGVDEDLVRRAKKYGASTPTEIVNFVTGEDLYAIGYVFAELIFSSLQLSGEPGTTRPPSDQATIKRLLEDVYSCDVRYGFRNYCAEEEVWEPAVEFLDENDGAGWEFLEYMIGFYKRLEASGANSQATYLSADALLTSRLFN